MLQQKIIISSSIRYFKILENKMASSSINNKNDGGDVREVQLLDINESAINSSFCDNASFTLTTISWQKGEISRFVELIIYTILFIKILGCATLIFFGLTVYHNMFFEIIGILYLLSIFSCCFFWYIKHCFGLCWECKNTLIFNENTKNVEIHQNGQFIFEIGFDEYDGLLYENYNVYINTKNQQNATKLNKYRCNPKNGRQFVLTVTDIWPLIKRKYQKAQFKPISIV